MRKNALRLGLLAVFALSGCDVVGSSSIPDGSAAPPDLAPFVLHRLETGVYQVQAVTITDDGCRLMPQTRKGAFVWLVRDATGTTLIEGFGSGFVADDGGNLRLQETVSGPCNYQLDRQAEIALPADNQPRADVDELQSARTGTCAPMVASCRSVFRLDFIRL